MVRKDHIIRLAVALTIGLGLAGGIMSSALASEGHSDNGDDYLNDAVKNPRFIEPYADRDPARYRIGNPQAGYDDRVAVGEERYYAPYGRGHAPYGRGRITVRPYGPGVE